MQDRKRDTDVQNRLLDSVGGGKGGMFGKNSIETCLLSRVKQITRLDACGISSSEPALLSIML